MRSVSADSPVRSLSPVWPRYTSIQVARGIGTYLYDEDGREFLDFTSGIGVTNTGHCHPRIVAVIQKQASQLLHGQVTIVYSRPLVELTGHLLSILPAELDCLFFSNSGSEAVEGALKLARQATGRTNVIAFQGGYHGRTVGAMALTTAKVSYRQHYQPLMSGAFIAPYPYSYQLKMDDVAATSWCVAQLELLLQTQSSPSETAAMIVEPVLGEGGYVVPPLNFLRAVREICTRHGILLILDEVQSGFGRTGAWFAFEHFGICPDILVMAKGLASGLPMSAIASPRHLMERWITGSHGGTYGGNPLAAAAAAETVNVIRDENLLGNATRQGNYLLEQLKSLKDESGALGDVRGLGLMIGNEFSDVHGNPDRAMALAVRLRCLEKGLLLITCGTQDHVIRWIPPLIVQRKEIDRALDIYREALRAETRVRA